MSLVGNARKPLAKSVFIPSELTASETDAAIHKKMFGSYFTTLIIFNEEMNDIVKMMKSLEEFDLLIKGISETIKIKAPKEIGGLLVCY